MFEHVIHMADGFCLYKYGYLFDGPKIESSLNAVLLIRCADNIVNSMNDSESYKILTNYKPFISDMFSTVLTVPLVCR